MKIIRYMDRSAEGAPTRRSPHNTSGGTAAGIENSYSDGLKPSDGRIRVILPIDRRIPVP